MNYQDHISQSQQKVYEKAVATKILDLMDKLRLSSSENNKRRWIWELLQNAKDVKSRQRNEVDIAVNFNASEKILIFRHNGRCFSTDNITFLIEQVSTKERSTDNPDETTGKFGTGFLTTHLLSEIVEVQGIVKDGDLPYSGCAIHVGQQIPYLIALCPFSMYQTDAISAV
jgi:HSP90 family molecular chaperone